MKKTVHIIGAGFSGMTLAYRLSQKGIPVKVYDKNPQAGGMIDTFALKNSFAESAAPSISRTLQVEKLCKDLGLKFLETSPRSKKRYIYRERPKTWPLGIFETFGLVFRIIRNKFCGTLKPKPQESLRDWGQRCLGSVQSQFTLETAMQGIYAGNSEKLSANLLLGHLFDKNRDRFKGTIGFKMGMIELFQALKQNVEALGGEIIFNTPVGLEDLSGPLVIATSASEAAYLFRNKNPEISQILSSIEMIPVMTATLTFPLERGLEGFGCLIPRGQGLKTLGILFNSSIFERAWIVRSESWILGGALNKEILEKTDEEIIELICNERRKIFKSDLKPSQFKITRFPRALPHYTLDLERSLAKLHLMQEDLEHQEIYLHGNYLGGIGLSKILQKTNELSERIAAKYV